MDFMSKVGLKMQGYNRDQISALEIVWSEIPEPIELVVTPDNYVYRDGLPVQVSIHYGENFADVDGHPVVILHPVSYGVYAPDEFYNLENLDAYRDELFETTTAEIRKKRLAESAEQIAAQSAQDIEPEPVQPPLTDGEKAEQGVVAQQLFEALRDGKPTEEFENFPLLREPTNVPQVGGPTQEECHSLYIADDLYLRCGFGRARLPLDSMRQCICFQPTCLHNPKPKPKTWKEKWLAQAAQNVEDEATNALMQSLVDAAKNGK